MRVPLRCRSPGFALLHRNCGCSLESADAFAIGFRARKRHAAPRRVCGGSLGRVHARSLGERASARSGARLRGQVHGTGTGFGGRSVARVCDRDLVRFGLGRLVLDVSRETLAPRRGGGDDHATNSSGLGRLEFRTTSSSHGWWILAHVRSKTTLGESIGTGTRIAGVRAGPCHEVGAGELVPRFFVRSGWLAVLGSHKPGDFLSTGHVYLLIIGRPPKSSTVDVGARDTTGL